MGGKIGLGAPPGYGEAAWRWPGPRIGAAHVLAGLLVLAGLILSYTASRRAINTPGLGEDFWPSRGAAEALLNGQSIYANHLFVYPPTAAVAFLPATLLPPVGAVHVWLYVEVIALILACFLATFPIGGWRWPLAAGLTTGLLMKGDLLGDNLWLTNPSLVLAPLAVGILLCFEEDRWLLGCALLAASLLLKPLLAPFVLVAMLRWRWRALAATLLPALVLTGIAMLSVPGGFEVGQVLGHLVNGSTLETHAGLYYNLSLQGLGSRLGAEGAFLALRVLTAAVAVLSALRWCRGPDGPGGTAAMGTLLLLSVLLVGRLSEAHYVIVAALCLLLAVVLRRDARWFLAAAPAFLLICVPRYYLGGVASGPAVSQVRYVLAEVLLGTAAAGMVWWPGRRAGVLQRWSRGRGGPRYLHPVGER